MTTVGVRKVGFFEAYSLGECLGSGHFAKVYRTTKRDDRSEWAVKVIDKRAASTNMAHVDRELTIMSTVNHPNLIKFVESFQTATNIFVVMEYVPGKDLFHTIVHLGSYSEADAARVMQGVFSALSYLHSLGIVHRDLKPENILVQSEDDISRIKITDFGLSNIIEGDELLKTPCGTLSYAAPEVLMQQSYGFAVDIWSVGVVLYILLCGFPPFASDNHHMTRANILEAKFSFNYAEWEEISDGAKDLVSSILQKDPDYRPAAVECLQHAWVQGLTVSNRSLTSSVESLKSTIYCGPVVIEPRKRLVLNEAAMNVEMHGEEDVV
eukprot:TRINITY_DN3528_c0_g1_i1.p1 TRINITY_DN3528_c0_g1~~TRINITY_DN3528_c0_g1_i1.p1  ORF type:complete len:324 (-),score=70.45 TRINITY_DN3528_c0_g1_i1:291-1262(-)